MRSLLFFFAILASNLFAELDVVFEEQPATIGKVNALIIRSLDKPIELNKLPKIADLTWHKHSVYTCDGHYYLKLKFISLSTTKKIKFGPISLQVGEKEVSINPSDLLINPAKYRLHNGKEQDYADLVNIEVNLGTKDRGYFWVGEKIPLTINVGIPDTIRDQIYYPRVESQGQLRNFGKYNYTQPKFAPIVATNYKLNGVQYRGYKFYTELKFTTPEKTAGTITIKSRVKSREPSPVEKLYNRGDIDSYIWQTTRKLPNIEIRPLPKRVMPAGIDSGLVGELSVTPTWETTTIRAGEINRLKFAINGFGDLSELDRHLNENYGELFSISIDCLDDLTSSRALVELVGDFSKLGLKNLDFIHFDPKLGSYQIAKIPTLTILPAKKVEIEPLLYPRIVNRSRIGLSHRFSWLIATVVVILLGMVLDKILQLVRSSEFQRRRSIKRVLRQIPSLDANSDIKVTLQLLIQLRELGQDTAVEELLVGMEKSDIAIIKNLLESNYSPNRGDNSNFDQSVIDRLKCFIKGMLLIGFLFLVIPNAGATVAPNTKTAEELYLQGKWERAKQLWLANVKYIAVVEQSPELQVNIGNCYFMQQQYEDAYSFYQRAENSLPRDQALQQLLARCRNRLGIAHDNPAWFSVVCKTLTIEEWGWLFTLLLTLSIGIYLRAKWWHKPQSKRRIWLLILILSLVLTFTVLRWYNFQLVDSFEKNPKAAKLSVNSVDLLTLSSLHYGQVPEVVNIKEEGCC